MRTTPSVLLASFVVAVLFLLIGCSSAKGGGAGGTGATCAEADGTRVITLPPSSSGTGVEALCVDGKYYYGMPLTTDCPAQPSEVDVYQLVKATCTTNGATCVSTDAQGTCSITCTNGIWAATNANVCTD